MLGEYSHTKSESLAQIRTTMAEIQYFCCGIVFLLAHPVDSESMKWSLSIIVYAVFVCLSVCLYVCVSVTFRYCVKTAKRYITQIMSHDRVFK